MEETFNRGPIPEKLKELSDSSAVICSHYSKEIVLPTKKKQTQNLI